MFMQEIIWGINNRNYCLQIRKEASIAQVFWELRFTPVEFLGTVFAGFYVMIPFLSPDWSTRSLCDLQPVLVYLHESIYTMRNLQKCILTMLQVYPNMFKNAYIRPIQIICLSLLHLIKSFSQTYVLNIIKTFCFK